MLFWSQTHKIYTKYRADKEEGCRPWLINRELKGNLHFNKKITLNHRKSMLQSSQSKIFLKKAFVSERNNF